MYYHAKNCTDLDPGNRVILVLVGGNEDDSEDVLVQHGTVVQRAVGASVNVDDHDPILLRDRVPGEGVRDNHNFSEDVPGDLVIEYGMGFCHPVFVIIVKEVPDGED